MSSALFVEKTGRSRGVIVNESAEVLFLSFSLFISFSPFLSLSAFLSYCFLLCYSINYSLYLRNNSVIFSGSDVLFLVFNNRCTANC